MVKQTKETSVNKKPNQENSSTFVNKKPKWAFRTIPMMSSCYRTPMSEVDRLFVSVVISQPVVQWPDAPGNIRIALGTFKPRRRQRIGKWSCTKFWYQTMTRYFFRNFLQNWCSKRPSIHESRSTTQKDRVQVNLKAFNKLMYYTVDLAESRATGRPRTLYLRFVTRGWPA